MQAMGAHGRLIVSFEDTPGVTNTTPKGVKLAFIKSSIKADQNQNASNVITGRRDPSEPYRGFIDVTGDMELPLDLRQVGVILRAAFGVPKTTSEGSDKYSHVFKLGASMPYMTIEQGFQDINTYAAYNGCKVSKLSFTFGGDNELTTTISIMGMKETITSASLDKAPVFLTNDKINFDNALLKEGGNINGISTEVSLDIDFALDGDTYCLGGGGFRSDINDGITKISGKLKAMFRDQQLLTKAADGTNSSLEIPLVKGDHSLTILMPEVKFKRSTPGIDGPKGVYIDMQYDAFYMDNINDTSIMFTLVNDVASYTTIAMPPPVVKMAAVPTSK